MTKARWFSIASDKWRNGLRCLRPRAAEPPDSEGFAGHPASIRLQKRPESCFWGLVVASQNITIGIVILTGLFASGCKKNSVASVEETNAAPVATNAPVVPEAPAPSRTRDLGVVQLTNHCETHIQLGGGKSCTITPHLIDPKHLQLTMVLESKMADGKTRGLNIMKVVTRPDQQFEVDFGSLNLTLTPQMAEP
jgi:hypothetical protein